MAKYLNLQKIKHQIKILWMDILDDINTNGKLQQASDLIGRKYQVLHTAITRDSLGEKLILLLKKHKKQLLKLKG